MENYLLKYTATPEIDDVIATIGRTEDIKLSPNNRRLAIADFLRNRILIFTIRINNTANGPSVSLGDYLILSSTALQAPHGVSFLDNENIIVANREGCINVFNLPAKCESNGERYFAPVCAIKGKRFKSKVISPGSLDCYQLSTRSYLILACNNYVHYITSHNLVFGKRVRVKNNKRVAQEGLEIPDGISVSPDGKWVAISNHMTGSVLLYKNKFGLNENLTRVGVLKEIVCPHGVRFSSDGKRIFVADAASPYLHVYRSHDGDWSGSHIPSNTIEILSSKVFQAGRNNPLEGGIKGIDINNEDSILLATCESQVLAFYDLRPLLSQPNRCIKNEISKFCKERDEHYETVQSSVNDVPWWSLWKLKRKVMEGY